MSLVLSGNGDITGLDPALFQSNEMGFLQSGTGAVATTVQAKLRESVSVFDFMTSAQIADVQAGTLGADVTAAVIAAFTHANLNLRVGLAANVLYPNCTLTLEPGRYSLATLAALIDVRCNLINKGAEFVAPAGYASEVLRVGHSTPTYNISGADVNLPDVTKAFTTSLTAGSVGVRLCNINASTIRFGRTNFFETGAKFGGIGEGTVYNNIYLGQHSYCKVLLSMTPGSGGWCNANTFHQGNLSQSPNYIDSTTRKSGWRHLVMDGRTPATSIVGNNFLGTSFEGNISEYMFDVNFAYGNNFYGCYHETGSPAVSVAVSGDTLTAVAHGLVVGDMVTFVATVTPTGMFLATAYYVVAAPTADTFKVSLSKAGTAVTFSSTGTSVTYYRQMRLLFAQAGAEIDANNRLYDWFMPPNIKLDVIETGTAINNGEVKAGIDFQYVNDAVDFPSYRAGQKSGTAATRAMFACYPVASNPNTQPKAWTTALSDRGVIYAASETETGRLFNTGGIMFYRRPADSASFEIPSATRTPSLTSTAALSCGALARTLFTFTLTNAATNDHLLLTPADALPDGILIAWARISAANTVQVCFYNWTGGTIALTVNLQACAFRRFY